MSAKERMPRLKNAPDTVETLNKVGNHFLEQDASTTEYGNGKAGDGSLVLRKPFDQCGERTYINESYPSSSEDAIGQIQHFRSLGKRG